MQVQVLVTEVTEEVVAAFQLSPQFLQAKGKTAGPTEGWLEAMVIPLAEAMRAGPMERWPEEMVT